MGHGTLLRKGKVKEVYALDDERVLFRFTDQISVFDKIIPTLIPDKGETLCRTSIYWFKVAQDRGIRTHFIEQKSKNEFIGRRVQIIPKPGNTDKNYLIPLEFIVRYYVAGSLMDRIKSGEISYKSLGFASPNISYGTPLPEPFFEITTKFEAHDRSVGISEAMEISGLDKREIEEIKENFLKIDAFINAKARSGGLIHVDGKKEFAMDENREIMVVDTFGTADEDRFWDATAYEQGNFIELSKEFVRQYYRKTGYYEKLMNARAAHMAEPDIPGLPEDIVQEVRRIYIEMYQKLTGEKF